MNWMPSDRNSSSAEKSCLVERTNRSKRRTTGRGSCLGLEKEQCLRNGWEKRQFLALRFCRGRRKGSALKNLAGALHSDGGGYTLLVGRGVNMEIPAALV